MQVIFWQNIISFHQAAHIRALASTPGVEVTWVADAAITPDRQRQGWSVPDAGAARTLVAPPNADVRALASAGGGDTVHVFSGISAFPMASKAFRICRKTDAQIGLLVEKRDARGLRGLARLAKHRLEATRFADRISFILTMGYTGPYGGANWYRRSGYPNEVVYPYGYFLAAPEMPPAQSRGSGDFRMSFVGRLEQAKGVDVLLHTVAGIPGKRWTVVLVGDGADRARYEALAATLGIASMVCFAGIRPNAEACTLIAESDLLVLPTRYDGWGVVVNEALIRGVPVVCSDRCGAMDLLQQPWRGETFPDGSVDALRAILERRIAQGGPSPEERERIAQWSRERISGEAAAAYLLEVIRHARHGGTRPAALWLDSEER